MDNKWCAEDFPIKKWECKYVLQYKGRYVYNWFSNFEYTPFTIIGCRVKSVENWYQANKAKHHSDFLKILNAPIPMSKRLGRKVEMRDDWEQIKFNIMWEGLVAKFTQNQDQLLKLRGWDYEIVEWNNWRDKIWGVPIEAISTDSNFYGFGMNALGVMLEQIKIQL